MPTNKRESLIFTLMMCAFMVFIMSVYNIFLHEGMSWSTIKSAWMGFPLAYLIGLICDWFIVAGIAKKIAFSIVKPDKGGRRPLKIAIAVSSCMVCGMVILMSLYGTVEAVGFSSLTPIVWMQNIPKNFVVALPLQLLIAGPLIRRVFRRVFPVGTVLG